MNDARDRTGAVGVLGASDTSSLSAQIRLAVTAFELARRRPDLDVRAFAPSGTAGEFRHALDEPVELIDGRRVQWRDLAAGIRLMVVTIDASDAVECAPSLFARDFARFSTASRCAWHAIGVRGVESHIAKTFVDAARDAVHVSLLDDGSGARWTECGGTAPASETPHPALLASRLFDAQMLDSRRVFLAAVDAWPRDGKPIVVDARVTGEHRELLAGLAARGPVVTCHGTGDTPGVYCLPDAAGLAERLAAIAGAQCLVADTRAALDVAAAFGVPAVAIDNVTPPSPIGVVPPADAIDAAVALLDAEYDALAVHAGGPVPQRDTWSRLVALQDALDARGRRLVAERVAMADAVSAERARGGLLEGRVAELQARIATLQHLQVPRWRRLLRRVKRQLGR